MKNFRNYLLLAGSIGIVSLMLVGSAKPTQAGVGEVLGGPFQIQLCDTYPCVSANQNVFSVPSNQRLVIESVTGHCAESEATVFLSTTVRGTTVAHNFVPLRTSNVVGTEASFSQSIRLYADPGTNVVLSGDVPLPTCQSVTISGLLTPTGL
jgi:hypothetical protein